MKTASVHRGDDGYLPIEGYAAIGNGRTVALVGLDGSIDWCPFPRFDRASVFARVLDNAIGGHWQIVPVQPWTVSRRFLGDTNVLVTTFSTESGVAELVDLMPSIAFGSDLGITQELWDGVLLRFVRGVSGTVRFRYEMLPGLDYARERATLEPIRDCGAVIGGQSCALRVTGSLPLTIHDQTLVSEFQVRAGEERYAAISFHGRGAAVWIDLEHDVAQGLLDREVEGWKRWISRCTYDGPYAEHVRRGALTLKMLDYLPSGAMVAAPTTSLPEDIGGVRNWDYRYAWIRDTSYALHALHSIGYRDEAEAFLQWVIDATDAHPAALQIMYRVDGTDDLEEVELPHLEGYRKSRPVRIGNAAYRQQQLDRFGEVVDAAFVHRRFGGVVNNALWEYICATVGEVLSRWQETDSGIWEVRSEPRRMTFSNVLCWVALDRAIRLAELDERDAPLDEWRARRDEMREEIMRLGVSERGIFTQGFGDDILDASALSFPLRNFIPVDDPVMTRTIQAIKDELTDGGLVARYKVYDTIENVDGLPGEEGRFIICSTWLIDCLIGLGLRDEAKEMLEQLLARANDVGLFAEMIDPRTGAHLGNFPQAFSHLGIITTIVNYARICGEAEAPYEPETITGALASGPVTRRLAGVLEF